MAQAEEGALWVILVKVEVGENVIQLLFVLRILHQNSLSNLDILANRRC
ncbi:MAG: hypothetical protein HLUCCO16_12260 [Phormidium sp. OSCR]|nr:MAG: hypothetical protein HLUCCO16_12260 [Phormidium sp. OSCR]